MSAQPVIASAILPALVPPAAPRPRAAFFGCRQTISRVFGQGRFEQIEEEADLYPEVITLENFDEHAPALRDLEVIFSTWGMPCLEASHLDRLPKLRALYYAAGSVQAFARPFLERNILVVSAWRANAVPAAEFTLGQILLAMKGYFRNTLEFRSPEKWTSSYVGPGIFGETVAILGAGAIGRKVIEFLRPFRVKVIVFDPFLERKAAVELGVECVSLEAAFRRGYVISNHLADVPDTKALLNAALFGVMRPSAAFINTGRGATVDEPGLTETLRHRTDLTALLDVTWPEPPAEGSALYTLPNIHLTTHLAGSVNDEFLRMSDLCLGEFRQWKSGGETRHAVSLPMLAVTT